MLYTIKRYSRKLIQDNPNDMFVFGDNLQRNGLGGQAGEARYESNSIGVATKKYPGMRDEDFFCDGDAGEWQRQTRQDLEYITNMMKYTNIVIPLDGIGTGLSELPQRSPLINSNIERFFDGLITDEVRKYKTQFKNLKRIYSMNRFKSANDLIIEYPGLIDIDHFSEYLYRLVWFAYHKSLDNKRILWKDTLPLYPKED